MSQAFPIVFMSKAQASAVCGTMTQTSKMPCKSSSLPTEACRTGFRMAKLKGSICATCYADKGFYRMYEKNIKPAQFGRLDAVLQAMSSEEQAQLWLSAMVAHIGSDAYFRHHDSGDLQGLEHLELIVSLAKLTPACKHWLPTREYGMVKAFIEKHGKESIPENLVIRLSAMYPDKPVIIPVSLQNIRGITASNVHASAAPVGHACNAPAQGGACLDCRACWGSEVVSYAMH